MRLICHIRAMAGSLPPSHLALLLILASAALAACGQGSGSGSSGY